MDTDIKITFRNGEVKDFPHVGRPGGSYTKSLRYEGGFAIVRDEYDVEIAYPADSIKSVEKRPARRW